MRRGAMRPPWSHLLSSCAVCAAPVCSRCSAARFCDALGPAADALRLPSPWREDLKPPRSRGASELFFLASELFFLPGFLLAICVRRDGEFVPCRRRSTVHGYRFTSASGNSDRIVRPV